MIGGVQPKLLLKLDGEEITLGKLFEELIGPNITTKWKLVRERDNLIKYSEDIKWVEWKEDGTFKAVHEDIDIGYTLIMSPFTKEFTWQTTRVIEIIDKGELHIKFKTENSKYILHKI